MTSVFVSHASGDDRIVTRVVADLRSSGHTVWVDKSDLAAGDSLAGSIQRGIEGSDAFLLLLSESAAQSRWVELEWQAALSRSMVDDSYTFLLARLDEVQVPLLLSSKKWIDVAADYEEAIATIRAALGPATSTGPRRTTVWYYDDTPESLQSFAARHAATFDVRVFSEVVELLSALTDAEASAAGLPDIVLVDLFCPRSGVDAEALAQTNLQIGEFLHAEHELLRYVDDAWRPIGVEIVESVRQFYSPERLPIVMHTQQGLSLLRAELLRDLERLAVGWLLKNRFSPETDRMMIEGAIMRSGARASAGKRRVLIIDDNPKFITAFRERQSAYYEIESIQSQDEVLPALAGLDESGNFPNVFLVDMYYPRGNDESAKRLIDLGNKKLAEFAALESSLEASIRRFYEPLGMSALQEIRDMYSPGELPVLVYVESGMLMLEERGIQQIERLGGGWLLQSRYDARTEQTMIVGEVVRARKARSRAHGAGSA